MTRPAWDFDYRPIQTGLVDEHSALDDMIVATETDVDPADVVQALTPLTEEIQVETVLSSFPLFWTRVRTCHPLDRCNCQRCLRASGVAVRYVASTRRGSQQLAPRLDMQSARPRRPTKWRIRAPSVAGEHATPGRWFVGELGVNVRRQTCGTGAGTRLAVIDNDAGHVEQLNLDDQVLVGTALPPRGSSHGALLVAWAVGAASRTNGSSPETAFVGVAPDASPRIYFIPKPGEEVLTLPLAIVRAVDDGADVVLCATHVEGQTSPMLDDALEMAARLGRDSRGTAVVMPCGRETSSPADSVHSSLSLGAGEPASDPRVLCIAPSGRSGGWFLWRDRRQRLRPFANRGPAVRWMAPGDDVAWPFGWPERLTHAESSGASAVAAGLLLLVLAQNPELALAELEEVLSRTVTEVAPDGPYDMNALADQNDVLPLARDPDGHNAKHGYGRLNATRACLLASDPIAAALTSIGEDEAAEAWLEMRQGQAWLRSLYTPELARWSARAILADQSLRHAVCTLARALRLIARDLDRLSSQLNGALLRQLVLLLRGLQTSRQAPGARTEVAQELLALVNRAMAAATSKAATREHERQMCALAIEIWPFSSSESGRIGNDQQEQGERDERLRA